MKRMLLIGGVEVPRRHVHGDALAARQLPCTERWQDRQRGSADRRKVGAVPHHLQPSRRSRCAASAGTRLGGRRSRRFESCPDAPVRRTSCGRCRCAWQNARDAIGEAAAGLRAAVHVLGQALARPAVARPRTHSHRCECVFLIVAGRKATKQRGNANCRGKNRLRKL